MDADSAAAGLRETARAIRKHVIRMTGAAGSGHPGGSLSATDLLTVLFFHEMNHRPEEPDWADRDRFVLSKGHAAPALYAAYAEAGYVDPAGLETLRKLGSPFQGHPDRRMLPILEASTGSLGQGLSIGIGLALGARLDGRSYRVHVLMGDGEVQEGQVWEAAMFAKHHALGALTAIVDANRLQLDGWVKEIIDLEPLSEKWSGFGWHVQEIDGHDIEAIIQAFTQARIVEDRPSVIIARTTKGRGVDFMENNPRFHGVAPNADEVARALAQLDGEASDDG